MNSHVKPNSKSPVDTEGDHRLAVSLKTLAQLLDADRTSVRRWLRSAGIRPLCLGRGKNGAVRYRWDDIQGWLNTRMAIE